MQLNRGRALGKGVGEARPFTENLRPFSHLALSACLAKAALPISLFDLPVLTFELGLLLMNSKIGFMTLCWVFIAG